MSRLIKDSFKPASRAASTSISLRKRMSGPAPSIAAATARRIRFMSSDDKSASLRLAVFARKACRATCSARRERVIVETFYYNENSQGGPMKMNRSSLLFLVPLISFCVPALHAQDAAKTAAPVAKIGGTILTEDDLRKEAGMSLYDAENALYQLKKN